MKKIVTGAFLFIVTFLLSIFLVAAIKIVDELIQRSKPTIWNYFAGYLQP